MNWVFFAPFLSFSEDDPTETSYNNFIESFLLYQRLFNYSGTIQNILELPYSIYNDIILKQIKLKNKEKEEFENLKQSQAKPKQQSPFKRRRIK